MKKFSIRARNPLKLLLLTSATVLATACGGGGGDGGGRSSGIFEDDGDLALNSEGIAAQCAAAAAGETTLLTPGEIALVCPEGAVVTPVDNGDNTAEEPPTGVGESIVPSATPTLNTAPPDVAGGPYYVAPNNSALLSGPIFGSGTRSNASLVKPLAFNIETTSNGLQLLELRAVDSPIRPSILGVIQHTGTEEICAVTLDGRLDFTSAGLPIDRGDDLEFNLADGVIGELGGSSQFSFISSSCISPGSLVYVSRPLSGSFNETAEIRYDSLTASSSDTRILDAAVIPVSYSIGTDGVDITIVNQSNETVDVFSVTIVVIDEFGQAFSSDFELVLEELSPGQEYVVEGALRDFEGQASTLRAIVDFEFP